MKRRSNFQFTNFCCTKELLQKDKKKLSDELSKDHVTEARLLKWPKDLISALGFIFTIDLVMDVEQYKNDQHYKGL